MMVDTFTYLSKKLSKEAVEKMGHTIPVNQPKENQGIEVSMVAREERIDWTGVKVKPVGNGMSFFRSANEIIIPSNKLEEWADGTLSLDSDGKDL